MKIKSTIILKQGAALAFAHGLKYSLSTYLPQRRFRCFYGCTKGPGHTVRGEYLKGGGVPCLIAVDKNVSGNAKEIGLAYASACGWG